MTTTYVTTEELSHLIKYDQRTIRERLKDSVLLEGRHYIRPFGGRKILYLWEAIEADMSASPTDDTHHTRKRTLPIPMANGATCNV